MIRLRLAIALVVSAAAPLAAVAQSTSCTKINQVPYTISAPGVYCVSSDLTLATRLGHAITVAADDVVVDLGGHRLSGSPDGAEGAGVYAFQRQHVTVMNGTIRGFNVGVFIDDYAPFSATEGHIVQNVRVTSGGIGASYGICVRGRGSVVRGNLVSASPYGIGSDGPDSRVVDNDVYGFAVEPGSSVGIIIGDAGTGTIVERNRVSASGGATSTLGISIWANARDIMVVGNKIVRAQTGVNFSSNPSSTATGLIRDNVTVGVAVPYVGGTNAGNNT